MTLWTWGPAAETRGQAGVGGHSGTRTASDRDVPRDNNNDATDTRPCSAAGSAHLGGGGGTGGGGQRLR